MRQRYHAINPTTAESEEVIEDIENEFLEWLGREIELMPTFNPHSARQYVRQLREESRNNLRYVLRVAYNRGFTDGV